jgi:hypothetical protein
MRHILAGLFLLGFCSPSLAESVVPESTTKVIETIRQVEYTTGTSYTVTGTNINIPGTPQQGANYNIMTQGAPFQFSETYLGPGVAKETWIDRTTETQSTTTSISVFTQ